MGEPWTAVNGWGGGRWRAEAAAVVNRKWTGRRRWRRARGFYWGSISGATRRSAARGRELCPRNGGGRARLGSLPRLGLRGGHRRGTELVDPPRVSTTRRRLLRFPGTKEPRPDRPHRGFFHGSARRGRRRTTPWSCHLHNLAAPGRCHGAASPSSSDPTRRSRRRDAAGAEGGLQRHGSVAASGPWTPTSAPSRTSTGSSPCMYVTSSSSFSPAFSSSPIFQCLLFQSKLKCIHCAICI